MSKPTKDPKSDIRQLIKPKAEEAAPTDSLSQGILASAMKEYKDDHHNATVKKKWRVSTGSLLLDVATGGVEPSLWRLAGQNNAGKTPQMLEIVRNILKDVPNSKCLWTIAEGRGLSEENIERCGLKFVTDPKEWVVGTVFVLYTNVFELFIKVVKDLVKNNPDGAVYAFVVDSVDGLILRDDAAKDITEAGRVAGVPMLAKKMLQSLSLGMFTYGHWMGLISQVTAEIKLDPYAKTPNRGGNFSGGNSLLHGSDVIVQYEASFLGDFVLDGPGKMNDQKTNTIGQNVRVSIVKTPIEASKKSAFTYPVKFGRKPSGVWVEREIADLMLDPNAGLATRTGGWIAFHPTLVKELADLGIEIPDKINGLDNLYALFEGNPSFTKHMFDKMKALKEAST